MSFNATVYRVLVASPGDLHEERAVIENVVHTWNASHAAAEGRVLLPVRWETHAVPEFGDRPQAILNRRLVAECDILIGAFWTRVGTPTGGFASGTAEEIEQFSRAGKPVLLYFSSRQIDPDRVDLDQLRRVREFRARMEQVALVTTFSSPAELESRLTRHLLDQVRRFAAMDPRPAAAAFIPVAEGEAGAAVPPEPRGRPVDAAAVGLLYHQYWQAFSEAVRKSPLRIRPPTARAQNYARLSLGLSDMRMNAFASVRDRSIGVELVMKHPECAPAYASLLAAQGEIEGELGTKLEWNEREGSYRIVLVEPGYDPLDRRDWPRQHAWLIDRVGAYLTSLLRRIKTLRAA